MAIIAKEKQNATLEVVHMRAGKVLDRQVRESDLIVNTGKALAAGLLGNVSSPVALGYIAIGTGTTAPAATDTTLQAEITTGGGARGASTNTLITTSVANDTLNMTKTFTFTSSFAVTEAGTFNAASAGTMYTRDTFGPDNVISGDTLQIIVKVQIS